MSERRFSAVAIALVSMLAASAFGSDELSLEELERRLLQHLHQARNARGAPLLESHPALSRLAKERANELARRAELGSTSGEVTSLERRLWRLGYAPHYWRLAIVAGHLDDPAIESTRLEPELLRNDLEHVAITCVPWTSGRQRTDDGLRANPRDQTLCLIVVGERQIRYQLASRRAASRSRSGATSRTG